MQAAPWAGIESVFWVPGLYRRVEMRWRGCSARIGMGKLNQLVILTS
jgi:hypothetical protein